MSVNAFDNSNVKTFGMEGTPLTIFSPAIKLEFNMFEPEDEEEDSFFGVKITDETVFVPGDSLKFVQLNLQHVKTLEEKQERITVTGEPGSKIIDLTGFGGAFRITAFVKTNGHYKADGSFKFSKEEGNIATVGRVQMLDHWSKKGGNEF